MKRVSGIFLCALIAAAANAQEPLDEYAVRSAIQWTDNLVKDFTDPRLGEYNFSAGFVGAAQRVIANWPEHYSAERLSDPQGFAEEVQAAVDALTHNRPGLPYAWATDAGHPDYMPDWNGNGTWGEPDDFDEDIDGDASVALFRHACPQEDGTVWFWTDTPGVCAEWGADGVTFPLGVAAEQTIVNGRAMALAATLWIPGSAFGGLSTTCSNGNCPLPAVPSLGSMAGSFPGLVFSNGFSSRQQHYYWVPMRMTRDGFIVLTYDPAGQGESQGTFFDLFTGTPTECEFSGSCQDIIDVLRWFKGDPIVASSTGQDSRSFPGAPKKTQSDTDPNPLLGPDILDTDKIAIAGNSMGAVTTLAYLRRADVAGEFQGKDPEGNSLPQVVAAVSMSGGQPTSPNVPLQFQTSDYDGSPLLVGPTYFGLTLGTSDQGIGYKPTKTTYDALRETAGEMVSVVVLESGVHTDHVNQPFITRTLWANRVAAHYLAAWLNCHVVDEGDVGAPSCQAAIQPMDSDPDKAHLSRGLPSEFASAAGTGMRGSTCIQPPDKATLAQEPEQFLRSAMGDFSWVDCQ